jgi:type IV secretory pathway VirB10-like protein
MSTPKQKISGGTKAIRQKPHVRMFSRKAGMIGGSVALASIMGVLILDPLELLKGMKPAPASHERIEPPPPKMDLEGLPTDRSKAGDAVTLDVASMGAPAPPPDKPLAPPKMDLPPANKGIPAGFPPAETAKGGGEQASKPKTIRKPLGFDGEDPYESIANASQQVQNGSNGPTPQMVAANQSGEVGSKADKFRSQNRGGQDSMFLGNQPISATPRPGYGKITPGFIIPAKLASATNSELGGSVVAMVSSDVYDEATGTCLMIDRKGSKIFGKLSDQVEYGQNRQQAVWKSIHTPKMHLDIGGMDATDASGGTGIESETNRHYGRLTIAAIGATALDVLGGWARGGKNSGTEVNIGTSAANNVASIGQQIIQRELQVKDELYQIIGMPVSLMVDRIIELPCLNRS